MKKFNPISPLICQTDCLSHMAYEGTVDLYVIQNSPQPPPPPPASNYPPIWPYPAQFANGTATVSVDALAFKFVATTPSDDLTAAFERLVYWDHLSCGCCFVARLFCISHCISSK